MRSTLSSIIDYSGFNPGGAFATPKDYFCPTKQWEYLYKSLGNIIFKGAAIENVCTVASFDLAIIEFVFDYSKSG